MTDDDPNEPAPSPSLSADVLAENDRPRPAGCRSPTAPGSAANDASPSPAASCVSLETRSTRSAARRGANGPRGELRASGERSRLWEPEARDQLTAQERQSAQLAAAGLSNREIGPRLFLSHRTISTHLYRVVPKLGITSRAELGAALAPRAAGGR